MTELETPTWWPFNSKFWKMPAEAELKGAESVPSSKPFEKEGAVVMIPAVVSDKAEVQSKLGKFIILDSALEIYDAGSSLLHRFEKEDVDDITVHSPYEITIRQRIPGKPDMTYQLISVKMPEVIPVLEGRYSKRLDFLDDALVFRNKIEDCPEETDCSTPPAGEWPAGQCIYRLPNLEPHSACCGMGSTCPGVSRCRLQLAVTDAYNPFRLSAYTCP